MLPEYDLVVIGSGPAGQKGAIAAAKARKNVAVVDRTPMIGGVSVHTGTIPSKTVREAIFQLTSRAVKAQYGNGRAAYGDISVRDVSVRVRDIIERETDVVRAQLTRNGISIYQGLALFLDPHTLTVQDGEDRHQLKANNILIACGTRPAHSPEIPFDDHRIVDTDHLHALSGVPRETIVVGTGVVGLEYGSFMAALGSRVTLIDPATSDSGLCRSGDCPSAVLSLAPAWHYVSFRRKGDARWNGHAPRIHIRGAGKRQENAR